MRRRVCALARALGLAAVVATARDTHGESTDDRAPASGVEEIVVTANRRTENVQDVSGGIRVLDGTELEQLGASGFDDYVFSIPGVDVNDSGTQTKIGIRGIANQTNTELGFGASASPIGLYLDDVPIQGNGILPDLTLYDLARIEVLKGPQGTLYGEGAQGGAIKMLLNKADPSELLVKGELGLGETRYGGGLNHQQNLALNVPVFGSWAVRLVGSRRFEAGFVDFPNRGTEDEDDATNTMGRVHLDGNVWEGFGVSTLVLHQRQRLDQFPQVQLAEGDLENRNSEKQFANTDFTLAGLTLDYDLGFAELTSASSWFQNDRQMMTRFPFLSPIVFVALGPIIGGEVPDLPAQPIEQEWLETDNHQWSVAEELRLVSSESVRIGVDWLDWVAFDWIGGFFYRKRENEFDYLIDNSLMTDVPPPVGPGVAQVIGVERFEQYALFGEATLHLPWRFELGLGLRGFRETVELDGIGYPRGPLYPLALLAGHPDDGIAGRFDIATTAITPKVSLSWLADDMRMLYFSVANGVRSGGTNQNAISLEITPLYEPDSLWSYEVGAKTQWLDGRLTANIAAFYNAWTDLQITSQETGGVRGSNAPVEIQVASILNAARAFTRGVEVELAALPIEGLTLGYNVFVGEGEISEGDPAGYVANGTKMPQLANLSYAAFADYQALRWPLYGFTPRFRFDTQRTGDRTQLPPVVGVAPAMEGFQIYNALVGLAGDRFEVTFDVRNLTDERPQLGANVLENETLTIGRPRTWMTRVAFRF